MDREVFEQLAELEHEQWAHWAQTLIDTEPSLSESRVERWKKYLVPYSELSEEVKNYDREWAERVVGILMDAGYWE